MPPRIYREGFRITRGRLGIRIEALDYHCSPLFLDRQGLTELGLLLSPGEPAAVSIKARRRAELRRWARRGGGSLRDGVRS